MNARSILSKIRDGDDLSLDEAVWLANGLANGDVSDAQAGAFAMAVCLRNLSDQGRVALTLAMRDSGDVLDWSLQGPVIDKHSTGGVGDCVSLALAPALACCGGFVPMISGRGLGHTGGTLDKLEAIPGFSSCQPLASFRKIVTELGCAIVSASGNLAPADRRLYAIRDVTGTIESIDLITASILSKKLAAGLEALALDVKTGNGAFMSAESDAVALAEALVATANGAGVPTLALITDMSQPLAPAAGNALEVAEICRLLTGDVPLGSPLGTLVVEIGARLLALAKLADDVPDGRRMLTKVLISGHAAEKFAAMVQAQGGSIDFLEHWQQNLPKAPVIAEVLSPVDGFLTSVATRELGEVVVALGGGRQREDDQINLSVGLSQILRVGDSVAKGQPLAVVHAASEAAASEAVKLTLAAMRIGDKPPAHLPPLIHSEVH